MAPHSRRRDAAGLGRRIWEHVRSRASDMPGEFTPDTRDDVTGWLWEGPFATLIRDAIPGIAETDLRRAREYLNACGMVVNVRGMVVNVRGNQRGRQPQWFIRAHWHRGPGGHVHVVTTARPGQPAAPPAGEPAPGGQPGELAHQPGQDIVAALRSLAHQVAELQADKDRLRGDNDRLCAEAERLRALMRQTGGEIARCASDLLAGAGTDSATHRNPVTVVQTLDGIPGGRHASQRGR